MKHLKKIVVLMMVSTLMLSMVACKKKAEPTIVGSWVCEEENREFEFNKDGTGTAKVGSIEIPIIGYEAKDGDLTITIEILNAEQTDKFTYELDKDSLTVKNDTFTWEYKRK